MACPCEKRNNKKACEAGTPPVLEVHSQECPILFHTVNIPASVGTVETLPPTPGAYRNTRVTYDADNVSYLYDSDGIPQLLTIPGPAGGVNSVNGKTGDVTLTAEDIGAATDTFFYTDSAESGNQRHIYKSPDMTDTASAQDIIDANDNGRVVLRMSTTIDPTEYNDAYLQNVYVASGDIQLLFLDNRTYYEYDASVNSETYFYYSTARIQFELSAGAGIGLSGNTISVTSVINGGTTAPTTSTVGTVGALYSYVDSGTGHLAICTAVSGSTYTWSTLV